MRCTNFCRCQLLFNLYEQLSQDRTGNLAGGAIANLIDIVGNALIYRVGRPMNVSIDMSISYLSNAKLDVSKH